MCSRFSLKLNLTMAVGCPGTQVAAAAVLLIKVPNEYGLQCRCCQVVNTALQQNIKSNLRWCDIWFEVFLFQSNSWNW
jgi:hypothetical protein